MPRLPARLAARRDARLEAHRETPTLGIPRQRSVGLDDLIDEGTALLDARRSRPTEESRGGR